MPRVGISINYLLYNSSLDEKNIDDLVYNIYGISGKERDNIDATLTK